MCAIQYHPEAIVQYFLEMSSKDDCISILVVNTKMDQSVHLSTTISVD